ncbi:LCP family glycopolymer transferase [Actinokineospora iranica]|uniref:Cell envelope-related function transcriptional attenuator common domain-containing protein n=1 Tax=Actinokineospora iranica TaxID=1271860 RepID=A0A1G6QEZ7_9PSEU|nr:LCP family protein [Actinokineospora iranica]SDC90266.1 cell envelope-related function transcriptional attenuator common domain-containing protein [Actinokineospora iranica]
MPDDYDRDGTPGSHAGGKRRAPEPTEQPRRRRRSMENAGGVSVSDLVERHSGSRSNLMPVPQPETAPDEADEVPRHQAPTRKSPEAPPAPEAAFRSAPDTDSGAQATPTGRRARPEPTPHPGRRSPDTPAGPAPRTSRRAPDPTLGGDAPPAFDPAAVAEPRTRGTAEPDLGPADPTGSGQAVTGTPGRRTRRAPEPGLGSDTPATDARSYPDPTRPRARRAAEPDLGSVGPDSGPRQHQFPFDSAAPQAGPRARRAAEPNLGAPDPGLHHDRPFDPGAPQTGPRARRATEPGPGNPDPHHDRPFDPGAPQTGSRARRAAEPGLGNSDSGPREGRPAFDSGAAHGGSRPGQPPSGQEPTPPQVGSRTGRRVLGSAPDAGARPPRRTLDSGQETGSAAFGPGSRAGEPGGADPTAAQPRPGSDAAQEPPRGAQSRRKPRTATHSVPADVIAQSTGQRPLERPARPQPDDGIPKTVADLLGPIAPAGKRGQQENFAQSARRGRADAQRALPDRGDAPRADETEVEGLPPVPAADPDSRRPTGQRSLPAGRRAPGQSTGRRPIPIEQTEPDFSTGLPALPADDRRPTRGPRPTAGPGGEPQSDARQLPGARQRPTAGPQGEFPADAQEPLPNTGHAPHPTGRRRPPTGTFPAGAQEPFPGNGNAPRPTGEFPTSAPEPLPDNGPRPTGGRRAPRPTGGFPADTPEPLPGSGPTPPPTGGFPTNTRRGGSAPRPTGEHPANPQEPFPGTGNTPHPTGTGRGGSAPRPFPANAQDPLPDNGNGPTGGRRGGSAPRPTGEHPAPTQEPFPGNGHEPNQRPRPIGEHPAHTQEPLPDNGHSPTGGRRGGSAPRPTGQHPAVPLPAPGSPAPHPGESRPPIPGAAPTGEFPAGPHRPTGGPGGPRPTGTFPVNPRQAPPSGTGKFPVDPRFPAAGEPPVPADASRPGDHPQPGADSRALPVRRGRRPEDAGVEPPGDIDQRLSGHDPDDAGPISRRLMAQGDAPTEVGGPVVPDDGQQPRPRIPRQQPPGNSSMPPLPPDGPQNPEAPTRVALTPPPNASAAEIMGLTTEMEPIGEAVQKRRRVDQTLARFSAVHDELKAEEKARKSKRIKLNPWAADGDALDEHLDELEQLPADPTVLVRPAAQEDAEEEQPATRLQEKKARNQARSTTIAKIVAAVVAGLVFLATGIGWAFTQWAEGGIEKVRALDPDSDSIQNAEGQRGDENFLLVGSDTREGAEAEEGLGDAGQVPGARSDTVMIAHVPADRKRVVVVSFPRDLEISRPGCERFDSKSNTYTGEQVTAQKVAKMNTAYQVGGPLCVTKVVQQISGLHITRFIGIDFDGFRGMVDAVDGVSVCVEKPMFDTKLNKWIVREPGKDVQLRGDQALDFVRARYVRGDPTSDYGRIKRQQRFLSSLLRKAMSSQVLLDPAKLTQFTGEFAKSTFGDNVGLQSLFQLGQSLQGLETGRVTFITVPTVGESNSRGNEVLRKEDTQALFQAIINDQPLPGEQPGPSAGASQARPQPAPLRAQQQPVDPRTLKIQVLNGGNQTGGIARRTAEKLTALGYTVVQVNAGPSVPKTVVRYGRGHEAQAQTLASSVPGAQLQEDPAMAAALMLVIGPEFTGQVVAPGSDGGGAAPPSAKLPQDLSTVNANDVTCA